MWSSFRNPKAKESAARDQTRPDMPALKYYTSDGAVLARSSQVGAIVVQDPEGDMLPSFCSTFSGHTGGHSRHQSDASSVTMTDFDSASVVLSEELNLPPITANHNGDYLGKMNCAFLRWEPCYPSERLAKAPKRDTKPALPERNPNRRHGGLCESIDGPLEMEGRHVRNEVTLVSATSVAAKWGRLKAADRQPSLPSRPDVPDKPCRTSSSKSAPLLFSPFKTFSVLKSK